MKRVPREEEAESEEVMRFLVVALVLLLFGCAVGPRNYRVCRGGVCGGWTTLEDAQGQAKVLRRTFPLSAAEVEVRSRPGAGVWPTK